MTEQQEPTQLPVSVPEPAPETMIVITFGPTIRDVRIQVTNGTPYQLWGAARMLEQYAEDAWQTAQMQQAMQAAKQAVDNGPQDHKTKKGKGN